MLCRLRGSSEDLSVVRGWPRDLRTNWLTEMGPESNTIHVDTENVVVDESESETNGSQRVVALSNLI